MGTRLGFVSIAVLSLVLMLVRPAAAAEHQHVIAGFQYVPSGTVAVHPLAGPHAGLEDLGKGYPVEKGDTIRFTNADPLTHTVTACSESVPFTGGCSPGQQPEFDFTVVPLADGVLDTSGLTKGTHTYFCRIHPGMRGSITVS